jgi:transposase
MTNVSEQQHRATLTVDEAAAILGISRTTAYESVRRGGIRDGTSAASRAIEGVAYTCPGRGSNPYST